MAFSFRDRFVTGLLPCEFFSNRQNHAARAFVDCGCLKRGGAHFPPCRNSRVHWALAFNLAANCLPHTQTRRRNRRFASRSDMRVVLIAESENGSATALGWARLEVAGMDRLRFCSDNHSVRSPCHSAAEASVRHPTERTRVPAGLFAALHGAPKRPTAQTAGWPQQIMPP